MVQPRSEGLSLWHARMAEATSPTSNSSASNGAGVKYIEDYASGYPQVSALISAHPSLLLFRRFTRLRARLLLKKQDRLSVLEQKLDELDHAEPRRLFLGTLRGDRNAARGSVYEQIEIALQDYDNFLERAEKMVARVSPKTRDIQSLQNWNQNTSSIFLDETKYLWEGTDLFSLGGVGRDEVVKALEGPLEDAMFWYQKLTKSKSSSISRDTHVQFASRSQIENLAHLCSACILIFILLVPIVILASVQSFAARVLTLMVSCTLFLASLLVLVKSRSGEAFLASVAYTAVLVVFFQSERVER